MIRDLLHDPISLFGIACALWLCWLLVQTGHSGGQHKNPAPPAPPPPEPTLPVHVLASLHREDSK